MIAIVIGVLVILFLIVFYFSNIKNYFKETFGDSASVKTTPDVLDLTQEFDDVVTYDNQPNGIIGLDTCIDKCQGYCVENGQTGSALCYPVHSDVAKDFNGLVVQNDQNLSYPNVD